MSLFSTNFKFLRGNISQKELGEAIGLSRSDINNYESDIAYPPVEKLLKISGHFKFNINALLTVDFEKLSSQQLDRLKANNLTTGGGLQVLAITVDNKNKENIDLVDVKARAGYLAGYADKEFIETLPRFQLPNPILSKNRSYRAFQIDGNSMLPIGDKSWIACQYVEDIKDIKNGHGYVLITRDEGVVFKRVYSQAKEKKSLLLVSLNPAYEPYEIKVRDVCEVWEFVLKFSDQMVDEMAA